MIGYFSIQLHVEADNLKLIDQEAGGHRWQRVPPTERRGRVHTSTVTVSVLDPDEIALNHAVTDDNIKVEWFSGTGAGGQHRNKHQNSAKITHLPTGIVQTAQTRSRESSYRAAMAALEARLAEVNRASKHNSISSTKRQQVGSGMRGDKVQTVQVQNDTVINHVNDKRCSYKSWSRGQLDLLW